MQRHPRLRGLIASVVLFVAAAGSASATPAIAAPSETPTGGSTSAASENQPPGGATAQAVTSATAERFQAKTLADDRGISLAAARERLSWQRKLPALERNAKRTLDDNFGGIWVDPTDGDRVKIALTGDASTADRTAAERVIAEDDVANAADVITVTHSNAELHDALDTIAGKIADVGGDSASPVSVGLRPDRNAVVLHLPPKAKTAVPAELTDVAHTAESFGDMVLIRYDAEPSRPVACSFNTYCDPPLRGGIRIWSDTAGCTAAFIASSRLDGRLFQLTAGHCFAARGQTWWTHFADGSKHTIGPVHNYRWDASGDMGILSINNPSGWRLPRGLVMVTDGPDTTAHHTYPIHRDAPSVVGQRVCTSGATTVQSDCGQVTEIGVAGGRITTPTLVRANFCVRAGDSGAPVYSNNTAYGIVVLAWGAGDRWCDVGYQDIQVAENILNVNVVHER